jgi:hypothetical protein
MGAETVAKEAGRIGVVTGDAVQITVTRDTPEETTQHDAIFAGVGTGRDGVSPTDLLFIDVDGKPGLYVFSISDVLIGARREGGDE